MFFKILCLLLALAVVAYGLPYQHGGDIDPGFSRYPNQGFVPDSGYSHAHGQGGFPSQGAGESHSGHRHGYQEHGY